MKKTHAINITNLACSLPLVKLAVRTKELNPGDTIKATSDCPGFEDDIRLWCESTGNEICNIYRNGSNVTITLCKAAA